MVRIIERNLKVEIGTNYDNLFEINAELMKRAIDSRTSEERRIARIYQENKRLLDKLYVNMVAMTEKCGN